MQRAVWLRNGELFGVRETVELAVAAEEGGWDGVFVSDSIWDGYSDPWTLLGAIAARTDRIRLGTWITPVPLQLPWRVAHAAASLDQLAEGRVILGVGLGTRWDHEMFGGVDDGPTLGRRYDEALTIITELWTGQPVSFSGEHFTLRDAVLPVLPVQQPRIPIVVGCWWPAERPFQRGARWDGIMPTWPALLGDEEGPEGQRPTGRPVVEEFREMLAYYQELTDDPGLIVVPAVREDGFAEACEEFGVTWTLTSRFEDADDLRRGPPS